MRRIFGLINSDGSIRSGHGFTSKHEKPGEYTVNFKRPFLQNPAVIASIDDNKVEMTDIKKDFSMFYDIHVISSSQNQIKFKIGNSLGQTDDFQFSFVAIE